MSPRIWTVPMTFHHLRHLHLSCIEHEPGLCVLPSLPALETLALNFCCYCLDCPRNGRGPSALLQFHGLPQLRTLSISGAQEQSVIWCGRATQLQTLEVTFSSGMDLNGLLACLGRDLKELYISDCEFVAEEPTPPVVFPVLRRVRILESLSSLASFCSVEVPLSAVFHVRIEPDDFEDLKDWPLVWELLTRNSVSLSLAGSTILQSPLHPTSRLSQVASLPHVRLEGQNWPRPVVAAKAGAVA
ncbi:uncharacterized protein BDW43DRAFT_293805 [Aspergillus alliaceus]|uniref:uncharacterized protein n=1 Tax=Petromyces alliaceus TaxID=209559 RepID=UPI0012A70C17|nr:uncharacterized protein BDW43DRAFT_293805 [Aspergillus alliaceus]KAB8227540.1 hypothetical protein BDW43DRAFT_293805 [Aspergillus alliaceus]